MTALRTPVAGVPTNTGPLATAAWLLARGLVPDHRDWAVEIAFHAAAARFAIEILPEEWGFTVHLGDRMSWIRVTDIAFVHGRDDFELLRATSSLEGLGRVSKLIERRVGHVFGRDDIEIRTTIDDSEPVIRAWAARL